MCEVENLDQVCGMAIADMAKAGASFPIDCFGIILGHAGRREAPGHEPAAADGQGLDG